MHRIVTLAPWAARPAPTTSEAVDLPLSLADLEAWIHTAAPGQMLEYHRGYLVLDRGAGSRLGEDAGEELDQVAIAVMEMAKAGQVHLIQRRHEGCDYSYIAVMARHGTRFGPGGPAWGRR
jgi:hypothetical protein